MASSARGTSSSTDLTPFTIKRKPLPTTLISSSSHEISQNTSNQALPPDTASQTSLLLRPSNNKPETHRWIPYSLKWPYLSAILAVTLILVALILYLDIRSGKENGLIDDNNEQQSVFFGWKFSPTLIAVIYSLLVSITLNDIQRTEAYVRLSKPDGALGKYTLLQAPGAWWDALIDGFSKTKNGGQRSWALICAATTTILTIFIISPFSSTFLVSKEIFISNAASFDNFPILQQNPMGFSDQPLTRFRTIGHMLQNVTTSAWLSDQYAIAPFWPSTFSTAPLDAVLEQKAETWRGQTLAFQTNYTCKQLHFQYSIVTDLVTHWIFATDDGCVREFIDYTYMVTDKFIWTTNTDVTGRNNTPILNTTVSPNCIGSEWIVVAKAWNDSEHTVARECKPEYYFANISVNATMSDSNSILTFNEEEYLADRKTLGSNLLDLGQFTTMFFSSDWNTHLAMASQAIFDLEGPSAMLSAMYNFSFSAILNDPALLTSAIKLKQRYFGEELRASLPFLNGSSIQSVGDIETVSARVVVVHSIAVLLEATLLLIAVIQVILICIIPRRHKHLDLKDDPARVVLVASLLSTTAGARQQLKSLKDISIQERQKALERVTACIKSGNLLIKHDAGSRSSIIDTEEDSNPIATDAWRSNVLKRWTIMLLTTIIIGILVAILVLYHFSESSGLYQKAFVYQMSIVFSDRHISTIAPYSIIPTLIAVGIALWWGAMETEFRSLQPFLTMAKRQTVFKKGPELTYQSSYLFFAVFKTIRNRNWFLCIICIGAVMVQIFTTAMSALWQLESGSRTFTTTLSRTLELRNIPIVSVGQRVDSPDSPGTLDVSVLSRLYNNLTQNWLYSATIEMTLNGTEPAWSRDGWSFVPFDLGSLDITDIGQLMAQESTLNDSFQTPTNLTIEFETPAIKGWLECSNWTSLLDISQFAHPLDITNSSIWNVTNNPDIESPGWGLGCGDSDVNIILLPNNSNSDPCSGQITTTTSSSLGRLICCENNNTQNEPGPAAMGYWTKNVNVTTYEDQLNFTIKWIYGQPVAGFQQVSNLYLDGTYIVWPQIPQMSAMNCRPIIGRSNASIKVDWPSARVQSYQILGDIVVDDTAWVDNFVAYSNPITNDTAPGWINENVTSSFGSLFMSALLAASNIANIGAESVDPIFIEDLSDNTFNFRLPGINMDLMSYSMFSQVQQNMTAFLDLDVMYEMANKTFSTFFQNYASTNVSLDSGGWVYQKINETLPPDLIASRANGTGVPPYVAPPPSTTNRTVEVQVLIPVKVLRMSPIAVWLCVAILIWLILTASVIIALEKQYLSNLIRGTKTLADVGALVAGSDALLAHIASGNPNVHDGKPLLTKLGWFRDKLGQERWGIELYGEDCGVEWIHEPHAGQSKYLSNREYEMVNMRGDEKDAISASRMPEAVHTNDVSDENISMLSVDDLSRRGSYTTTYGQSTRSWVSG